MQEVGIGSVQTPSEPVQCGKYELLERIGAGGMAEVFRARLETVAGFEKKVCIKRILPHLSRREDFVKMFVNEAKIAARIQHQNVVQVHELGLAEDGQLFIAMELVEGRDLRHLLRAAYNSKVRMPTWFALHVICEVLEGLSCAHEQSLIHRDVTPQNIFVSTRGEVKLADFGIARARGVVSGTEAGQIKGAIHYMAPEALLDEGPDARADLFSIGVVLYECLTKTRPFSGVSNYETAQMIINASRQPPSRLNPEVPPELDAVVVRAMAIEAKDRFESAAALQAELLRLLAVIRPHPLPSDVKFVVDVLCGRAEPSPAMSTATVDLVPAGPLFSVPQGSDVPQRDADEETEEIQIPAYAPPWGDTGEIVAAKTTGTAFSTHSMRGIQPWSDFATMVRSWPKCTPERLMVPGSSWMSANRFLDLCGLDALVSRAPTLEQVTSVGRLEETSLIALMTSLARRKVTGRLVLMDADAKRVSLRHIDIVLGAPTYVFSNHIELQLPDLLARSRVVRAQDMNQLATTVIQDGVCIEHAATALGGRRLEQFWPGVMAQRLTELFRWRIGKFAFDARADLQRRSPFAASLYEFAMPAARTYTYEELKAWARPIVKTPLATKSPVTDIVERFRLTAFEENKLRGIQAGASPYDLLHADPDNAHPTLGVLFAMAQAGEIGPA